MGRKFDGNEKRVACALREEGLTHWQKAARVGWTHTINSLFNKNDIIRTVKRKTGTGLSNKFTTFENNLLEK